ncbi:MAG: VWA domain-containing protein, partial [Bacteroidota bacterium]
KIRFLGIALLLGCLLGACKEEEPVTITQHNGLRLLIQNEYTTPPAKVSVFFKVEKKDGSPVAGLLDSDFSIYEKGRNDQAARKISTDEAERQISPRAQLFSYNTLLVLDLSGSVTNNNLPALKEAAKQFIQEVIPENSDGSVRIAIHWFDGEDELHQLTDFLGDADPLFEAIEGISPDISTDNSTDLFGAVLKGIDEVNAASDFNDTRISAASMVVFTDGTDQAARYSKEQAFTKVENFQDEMTFYTIGLGSEIDEEVLTKIGVNSFEFASNTDKLIEVFRRIAQRVSDEANSYYLFEYCSPKRNGMNELTIEVIQGMLRGEETTSFVADRFTGGCSL